MFFKQEPYDLQPAEVIAVGSQTTQAIHFGYMLELAQQDQDLTTLAMQLPSRGKALFAVCVGLCTLLLLVDSLVDRRGRRPGGRSPPPTLRLLRLVGVLCNQIPLRLSELGRPALHAGCFLLLVGFRQIGLMLVATVKTDLVVLDLTDAMDRPEQLLTNHRQPCFLANEKYLLDFERARPQSALHALWTQPGRQRCVLDKTLESYNKIMPELRSRIAIARLTYMWETFALNFPCQNNLTPATKISPQK